jgi:hypothetical protein
MKQFRSDGKLKRITVHCNILFGEFQIVFHTGRDHDYLVWNLPYGTSKQLMRYLRRTRPCTPKIEHYEPSGEVSRAQGVGTIVGRQGKIIGSRTVAHICDEGIVLTHRVADGEVKNGCQPGNTYDRRKKIEIFWINFHGVKIKKSLPCVSAKQASFLKRQKTLFRIKKRRYNGNKLLYQEHFCRSELPVCLQPGKIRTTAEISSVERDGV